MLLTDIADYGLVWPTWLGWGAAGLMAAAMLLLLAIRQPRVVASLRHFLLRASTLRGRLLVGFSIVAVIPLLTLPPLLGMNSASSMQREQAAALEGLAQTIADSLPGMVTKRVELVKGLATHISAAGDFSDTALVDWLLRHHRANREFVSMWIAKPDGHVPVATAARNGSAERWGGPMAGVGVMDYFQSAVEQGGNYVSTVRKGVSAGFEPMVFISAPIGREGEQPWGYLQAQLDLSKVFGHFVMQDARAGSEILMADSKDRVMLSSPRLQFRKFEDLRGHALYAAMVRQPEATSFAFDGTIRTSGDSGRYVVATRVLPKQGWRVFAVTSQAPVQNLIRLPLLLGALWILLTLLLARGFSGLFGEAVAQPLKKLDESLDIFDAERTISIIPQAPSDAPSEVQDIYKKVRDSMRKSRDSYRNMMRALNEGAELKRQLQEVSGGKVGSDPGAISVIEGEAEQTLINHPSDYHGRMDAVTQLPGRELFWEFFDEAWGLGVVAETSLSLILLAVGSKNDTTLKALADALGDTGGRSLDLLARIDEHEFAVVLPDTNLNGALAVAERTQLSIRDAVAKTCGERMPKMNIGVVSIVPNERGNSKSFVEVGRRVLKASNKNGDGNIAYADEKGKVRLAATATATATAKAKADTIDWDQDVG